MPVYTLRGGPYDADIICISGSPDYICKPEPLTPVSLITHQKPDTATELKIFYYKRTVCNDKIEYWYERCAS